MRARFDVAIVGAGPAGSATAALLAKRGATVALVDRATFPRPKPCAEFLNPDTVVRIERLGALAPIRARAAPVLAMRLVAPSGAEATGRFDATPGLALPRELLDHALLTHAVACGAEPLLGAGMARVERDGPAWRVILGGAGSPALSADLLIGADGMHSRVARQTVGVRRPTSRRMALVTHYADVPELAGRAEMHVTAFGYVGLAPVGGGMVNVSAVVEPHRVPPAPDATTWLAQLLETVPDVRHRLAQGRRVDRVRGIGPFGRRARRAWDRRLLLVGDAADFYDPFTGDGIWAALAGAELAAAAAATPDDLRGYGTARRRALRGKWAVERLVSAAVGRPRLFDHIARRLARRQDLTDILLGVTGHTLPAGRALSPGFLLALAR